MCGFLCLMFVGLYEVIIKKAFIEKFRGFKQVGFSLGEQITLIAGQNGTQKSTLLGILSQTFTIPPKDHVFSGQKPLSGDSYRSTFSSKFRLSNERDLPGEHEWSLYFKDKHLHSDIDEDGKFTIQSYAREDTIRFWQKGTKDKGSGYVQLPVIYLSLKRLIPIAEAGRVNERDIKLTQDEQMWFTENYNRILFSRDNLESIDYLEGPNKNTLCVTTDHYDWQSNSSGQDNLGKILLAVLSFMRLKRDFPADYKGGILAIDEIDATLYPGSQVKLLELMSSFCKAAKIQVIATTHSLSMLEKICELKKQRGRDQHFNCVYLKKKDGEVEIEETPDYSRIMHNLTMTVGSSLPKKQTVIFTEDAECIHFLKAILKNRFKGLKYSDITLGCDNLIQLAEKKIPSFTYPNSIVVLDGDARANPKLNKLKNYICLPGSVSPECMLATFLDSLSDRSEFWTEKNEDYNKSVCFGTYTLNDIRNGRGNKKPRDIAKEWYKEQVALGVWGQQGRTVFNYLLKTIEVDVEIFLDKFSTLYEDLN